MQNKAFDKYCAVGEALTGNGTSSALGECFIPYKREIKIINTIMPSRDITTAHYPQNSKTSCNPSVRKNMPIQKLEELNEFVGQEISINKIGQNNIYQLFPRYTKNIGILRKYGALYFLECNDGVIAITQFLLKLQEPQLIV